MWQRVKVSIKHIAAPTSDLDPCSQVNGFREHMSSDRSTLHVGANVSSGGCNGLGTTEAWLRVTCTMAGGVPADSTGCNITVRTMVHPLIIPPGRPT